MVQSLGQATAGCQIHGGSGDTTPCRMTGVTCVTVKSLRSSYTGLYPQSGVQPLPLHHLRKIHRLDLSVHP